MTYGGSPLKVLVDVSHKLSTFFVSQTIIDKPKKCKRVNDRLNHTVTDIDQLMIIDRCRCDR